MCGGEPVEAFNLRVYGYKYYGTDISDKLINIAQENNPDGIFMITNGETIPYESNFFNFVVCLGVLHHVPDVNLTVSEIIRVTMPRGYIYVREPMWIKQGKGKSPFERGIQLSEIADLISENKVNILACSFSHNSLLFFLINHLLPLKIGLSLGFWKIAFMVDTFINKILVSRIVPINFYKKNKAGVFQYYSSEETRSIRNTHR